MTSVHPFGCFNKRPKFPETFLSVIESRGLWDTAWITKRRYTKEKSYINLTGPGAHLIFITTSSDWLQAPENLLRDWTDVEIINPERCGPTGVHQCVQQCLHWRISVKLIGKLHKSQLKLKTRLPKPGQVQIKSQVKFKNYSVKLSY